MSSIACARTLSDTQCCEPFFPLQHSKTPRTPNLSKICPSDCFWGCQSGGQKFAKKNCQNLKNHNFQTKFDNFFQIFDPLTGTPKNNRWGKFRTNLGFGAFLNAVRGKRFRKLSAQSSFHEKASLGTPKVLEGNLFTYSWSFFAYSLLTVH